MLVLMPDAMVEDDALIERDVLGGGIEVALHQELIADRIPDHRWRAADALIAYYGVPIDRALVERLDNCRIVVRAGVGYDHIDVAACGRRGIPVCNVPDYGTTEVADHAIALMLGLARGLVSYHARLLADPHAGWHWSGAPLVRRLRGATFGVVGLGRIGTAAARRARGLDMAVSFYDPYPAGRRRPRARLPPGAEPRGAARRGRRGQPALPADRRQRQPDQRRGARGDEEGRAADQHRARRPRRPRRARGGAARGPRSAAPGSTSCRPSRPIRRTR